MCIVVAMVALATIGFRFSCHCDVTMSLIEYCKGMNGKIKNVM